MSIKLPRLSIVCLPLLTITKLDLFKACVQLGDRGLHVAPGPKFQLLHGVVALVPCPIERFASLAETTANVKEVDVTAKTVLSSASLPREAFHSSLG